MKKIILAIHGLGNKPKQKILKSWWENSLLEGLNRAGTPYESIPFEIVYWADITHAEPLDPELKDKDHPLYDREPYIKGPSEFVRRTESLKSKLYHYISEQLDKIFLNPDLSINFRGVTDQIIHRYFSDLQKYLIDDCSSLTDPRCSVNIAIRNRLTETLQQYKKYDILLIAHSMGSIIAFDVLMDPALPVKIHTLVTIGSPLGLPVIMSREYNKQKLIKPDLVKPKAPDSIKAAWFNMADKEDKVAMDPTLNDDYAPNKHGTSAKDITIYNDYTIHEKRNPHKAYGYLRTPEIAEIIDDFLAQTHRFSFLKQGYHLAKNLVADFFRFCQKPFKR